MKERPILFNGEMVCAILDGRKTQTRRIVKNPDHLGCLTGDCPHEQQWECDQNVLRECPFGQPGDRLWVRETWQTDPAGKWGECYRASGHSNRCNFDKHLWRPSIHMPRWASRITLEITAVRVERLNEISETDAYREGVYPSGVTLRHGEAQSMFRQLWGSAYGEEAWHENQWVWVIEFKRVGS